MQTTPADTGTWVLTLRSEHAKTSVQCDSEHAGRRHLIGYVRERWPAAFPGESMPDAPGEAVAAYFSATGESFSLVEGELGI